MIVLDASAAVDLLLRSQPVADRLRERLQRPGETLHVPHVFDLEVAQAVRRRTLRAEISPARGRRALDRLAELRLTRYGHARLLDRIWELRENFTVFDAAYLALAETLRASLVTVDAKLTSPTGSRARVELLT